MGLCLLGFFEDVERHCWYGDLLALAVSPSFQRQGVGRALLRNAHSECRATPRLLELRLSVSERNRSALALFQKEGFSQRPYELGTYRNGELGNGSWALKPTAQLLTSEFLKSNLGNEGQ